MRSYAIELGYPIALVGCRCGECGLDCCEYDLAVFSTRNNDSRIVRLGRNIVEELHFSASAKNAVDNSPLAVSQDVVVIKDSNSMALSSLAEEKRRTPIRLRLLRSRAKRSLVRSLFYQGRAHTAESKSDYLVAAMWLKAAAFEFSRGCLELSGTTPMPTHELSQLRTKSNTQTTDRVGLGLAMEIIGLERASRSALARSIPAAEELLKDRYDIELIITKTRTLLEKQMIADCYYYLGGAVCSLFKPRPSTYQNESQVDLVQNSKLIQMALDLSIDPSTIKKQQVALFKEVSNALRGA